MSARTKSGLFETPHKTSPVTPRVPKVTKVSSKIESDSAASSPLQSGRLSTEKSSKGTEPRPKSVESKPLERRSPRITPPERRFGKGAELQSQLDLAQEDLKRTKDVVEKLENEKTQLVVELNEAKKEATDAHDKLSEALIGQKRAEENSEIEKFRAEEMEQASIEAAQKIEQKWQLEVEGIKKQRETDIAFLQAANQEIERLKHEVAVALEVKTSALNHAEDATKMAEANAEKVEKLMNELVQLRASLDATRASQIAAHEEKVMIDAQWEEKAKQLAEEVEKLNHEKSALENELERVKSVEVKLAETELIVQRLNNEVKEVKNSESDAIKSAGEWKKKAESLEMENEKVKLAERSASDSVVSLLKQLEESNTFLNEAEKDISSLKGSVEALEASLGEQRGDLERSDKQLESAKNEADSMAKTAESLKIEIAKLNEENVQLNENKALMSSELKSVMEEKSKLSDELQIVREDEEKKTKAMDDLAMALQEVSAENKTSKAALEAAEDQLEEVRNQVEDMKLLLQINEDKYKSLIDEAKGELHHHKNAAEKNDTEVRNLKAEFDAKERNLLSSIKQSQMEITALKGETKRLTISLEKAESEARTTKDDSVKLANHINQMKTEMNTVKQVAEETKSEAIKLKEMLAEKENELIRIAEENRELHARETAAMERAEELSKLLEEKKLTEVEENHNIHIEEEEEVFKPRELHEPMNGVPHEKIDKSVSRFSSRHFDDVQGDVISPDNNGHVKIKSDDENSYMVDDSVDLESLAWENCKIGDGDANTKDSYQESVDEEFDRMIDDSLIHENGSDVELVARTASMSKQPQKKKNKALLQKFGNLLKMKNNHGHGHSHSHNHK